MHLFANGRVRRLGLNVHLWIGLSLAALLVPISLSGALLVWHEEIEALFNPGRYDVPEGQVLPASQLMALSEALRSKNSNGLTTVVVEDKNGAANRVTQLSGDRAACSCAGFFPTVLAVTGIMIWLRSRRVANAGAGARPLPQLDAAE